MKKSRLHTSRHDMHNGGNNMQTNTSSMCCRFLRAVLAACFLCISFNTMAAPVTLSYSGTAKGYEFIDLSSFIPVGTSMQLSLTFNETFSDHTYDFSDNLGPVSGTMSVGGLSYAFNSYEPFSYSYDINTGDVISVRPMFTGSGPAPSGGELFGLFLTFTSDLTLSGNPFLGFGFTTTFPDGFAVTNYGYVEFEGQGSIRLANQVPEPASLALLGLGLLGLCAARRKQKVA